MVLKPRGISLSSPSSRGRPPSRSLTMVDLFLNRVLVENNWDQDKLNTEREIVGILENRITLLFFASAACQKCQEFLPALNNFFKRLKDPAYIEYPKLLALIFIRSFSFISTLHTSRMV